MMNRNNNRLKMIKAECNQMCPDQEFNMRVKNNIVNVLEKKLIEYSISLFNFIKENIVKKSFK
jgi:hypothetical protein